MNEQEPTNKEILDVINTFASNVEDRFTNIDDRFTNIDDRFTKIDDRFTNLETGLRREIREAEHRMLDHFDDKLADMEGIVVIRQRKQDNKVNKILELLERHKLAPAEEIQSIREIHIFPQPPAIN